MRLTLDITLDGESLPVLSWEDGPVECEPERIRDDQRRALFAAFGQVFGVPYRDARVMFTRMILGKDVDAPVSWSCWNKAAITADEASRLLDVLDACERTMLAWEGAA